MFENYPQPTHFLLHLSDTHFVTDPNEPLHHIVTPDANLARLFEEFDRGGVTPDAMIFTGDLADTGGEAAYDRLRALIEPIAERYGAELIWVMGNHDERGAFRRRLLDQEAGDTSPIDRVFDVNGLRIIALDSTVPGVHYGDIAEEQLEWLAGVLETPAPHGSILALHHPPVWSPLGAIRLFELQHQERLAEVVRDSDIRGIIGGHLHYNTTSTFAGIPVVVASATCYTQDLNAVFPSMRGQDGAQSYNLVHVYDDRVLHTTVPLGDYPTAYEFSAENVAELEAFMRLSPEDQAAAIAAHAKQA